MEERAAANGVRIIGEGVAPVTQDLVEGGEVVDMIVGDGLSEQVNRSGFSGGPIS